MRQAVHYIKPATVDTDPLKIEGLKPNVSSDNELVIDNSGMIRFSNKPASPLFFAMLKTNVSIPGSGTNVATVALVYDSLVKTSATFSYDLATGIMSFNEPGSYVIVMQSAFIDNVDQQQFTMGIRQVGQTNYLARGTKYAPKAYTSVPPSIIGQLMQFTTMIKVPSNGYQVEFIVASTSCKVLAIEKGTSGSGNVTNISIQKI